jgi:predicted aspartyl protease
MATERIHTWYENSYLTAYTPAAPVAVIQIAGPGVDDWIEIIDAFIDSGADATIVPEKVLNQVSASVWDQAWLSSQWGEQRQVFRYEIDLKIAGRVFPGMVVVLDELSDEVILGRDFLQQVRLLLDGPAQNMRLIE